MNEKITTKKEQKQKQKRIKRNGTILVSRIVNVCI